MNQTNLFRLSRAANCIQWTTVTGSFTIDSGCEERVYIHRAPANGKKTDGQCVGTTAPSQPAPETLSPGTYNPSQMGPCDYCVQVDSADNDTGGTAQYTGECPIATAKPELSCNDTCTNDNECRTIGNLYFCEPQTKRCRHILYPEQSNCQPICNSECIRDNECSTVNSNWTCEGETLRDPISNSTPGNCRLATNLSSTTCEPPAIVYECNSTCTTPEQCTNALGASYTCDTTSQKCRLESNLTSESCQPAAIVYQCNSSCTTPEQCTGALGTEYVCDTTSQTCRLGSNPTSDTCTPAVDETFACQCLDLRVYDSSWTLLNPAALASLQSGTKIMIAAIGVSDNPEITMARFSVNSGDWLETSQFREISNGSGANINEFYVEYAIPDVPAGQASFTISIRGQLYHPDFGWF